MGLFCMDRLGVALLSLLLCGTTLLSAATLTNGEYFVDADPGVGLATVLTAQDGAFDSAVETLVPQAISASNLTVGVHRFGFRFQDGLGRWGNALFLDLEVQDAGPLVFDSPLNSSNTAPHWKSLVAAQYTLDGGGWQSLAAKDGAFDSSQEDAGASFSVAPLPPGVHRILLRFQDVTGNWGNPQSMDISVEQLPAIVNLQNLVQHWDGGPHCASAITDPPGLQVDLTYNGMTNCPVDGGSYQVVGNVNDITYFGVVTNTLVIDKAPAIVTLTNLVQTYDGTARFVAAVTIPSGLAVNITYNSSPSVPITGGSYTVIATINETNYCGSVTNRLVVLPIAATTVVLSDLIRAYDGGLKCASYTSVPPGLQVDLTYNGSSNCPSAMGSYTVVGVVNDSSYYGAVTNTMLIGEAPHFALQYSFDIETGYDWGGQPDTGFLILRNTGLTSFRGRIRIQGILADGRTMAQAFGGYYMDTGEGYAFPPNASVGFRPGPESSNYGGFNKVPNAPDNGIELVMEGQVDVGSVALHVFDKDIHSSSGRGNPFGIYTDAYVMQGGDPYGRDCSDNYEVSQAHGLYHFGGGVSRNLTNQSLVFGDTLRLEVAVVGTDPLAYQWFKDGQLLSDSTNGPAYLKPGVLVEDSGDYRVTVSNAFGTCTSAVAHVAVFMPPSITRQPQDVLISGGQSTAFNVSVSGSEPLVCQWWRDGVLLPGATNFTFAISDVEPVRIGNYSVVVTNWAGSVTSRVATLSIPGYNFALWRGLAAYFPFNGNANDESGNGMNSSPNEVGLTSDRFGNPNSAYSFNGSSSYISAPLDISETSYTVAFWFRTTNPNCGLYSVSVSPLGGGGDDRDIYLSSGNLSARIYSDETIRTSGINYADGNWHQLVHLYDISGIGQRIFVDGQLKVSGGKTYSDFSWQQCVNIGFTPVAPQRFTDGQIDDVRVYRRSISTDEVAQFYVYETTTAPVITTQPADVVAHIGDTATFSVGVTNFGTVTYQWFKGSVSIPGETNSTLTLPNVQLSQADGYQVAITNIIGAVTSGVANLTVLKLDPAITVLPAGRAITYGQALTASSLSGGLGSVPGTFAYADSSLAPNSAGFTNVVVVFTPDDTADYNQALTNIAVQVNRAPASLILGGLSQTYDGVAKIATATTSPTNLAVALTYNGSSSAPTNAGAYTVAGAVLDSNYIAISTNTLIIAKAGAALIPSDLSLAHDGSGMRFLQHSAIRVERGCHLQWHC